MRRYVRILDRHSRIAIWGFGKEGQAAYRFLIKRNPNLDVTVLLDAAPTAALDVRPSTPVLFGESVSTALATGRFDWVIKSPGVSIYKNDVLQSKKLGVQYTSATNLWFEQFPNEKTIIVTGTKGKSTTATLLHFLLQQYGAKTSLIGNMGRPALGEQPGRDYTVLELSSYQIADLVHGPDVALVTNLFPEHVPWHGSVEQYYADKLGVLNISPKTFSVCNHSDVNQRRMLAGQARVKWFNKAPEGFWSKNNDLFYSDRKIHLEAFPLRGAHNYSNLAGVCTTLDVLGIGDVRHSLNLEGFSPLPHRLTEYTVGDQIICVDDSISTTPDSTLAALNVFADKEIILFLGGYERGQDYAKLIKSLKLFNIKQIMLLNGNGRRIQEELAKWPDTGLKVFPPAELEDAIAIASKAARSGTVMLLSPAAPSFGEFKNFEERGNLFLECCRSIFEAPGEAGDKSVKS